MSNETEKDDLVIRYFFGELDAAEVSRIEQDWLTDNVFFERLLSIEQSLIDDCVTGRLSEPERKKVESFLETSGRRELEVDSVKELISDLSRIRTVNTTDTATVPTERQRRRRLFHALRGFGESTYRFSFVLPGLVLAVGVGLISWNIILNHKLSQIEAVQVELENQNRDLKVQLDSQDTGSKDLSQQIEKLNRRNEQIEKEFDNLRESNASTTQRDIVALALPLQTFNRNDGQLREVRLSPNTKWLQITIDLSGDHFKQFSAVINSFEEHLVWSKDNLSALHKHGRLILMVPAKTLVNGDYILTLRGQKENSLLVLGEYYFRVKKIA